MQFGNSRFARILGTRRAATAAALLVLLAAATAFLHAGEYLSGIVWPRPKVIQPGDGSAPPSDAIVLFDGKDLSKWQDGRDWLVKDGYAISQKHDLSTKRAFGDCQLHVEWAEPAKVEGSGQGRGNSGVFMQGIYEIQVLDSYQNETYYDGQCGAVYKENPPLVNACRKPGEWQSYDIVWQGPRFDAQGKLTRPAYVTVLQNGVLVQNHYKLLGSTSWDAKPSYAPHAQKLPLKLQFHGNPVRFRNIWIREL
jgi:hypothetical protein